MMLPNDQRVGFLIATAVEVLKNCAALIGRKPLDSQEVANLYHSPQVFTFLSEFAEAPGEEMMASRALVRLACRKLSRKFMRAFMKQAILGHDNEDRDYAVMYATHKVTVKKSLSPGAMISMVVRRQIQREE